MSNIKKCFKSRWGIDGFIVEADYSQIEVIVQAVLSNDSQMYKDILDGVDFHCKRLAFKLKEDYDEVYEKCHNENHPDYDRYSTMRTHIKVFSFQKAYGAGPPKIAATLGIPLKDVKEFFEVEEALYPSIIPMQDAWIAEVESTKRPSTARTHKGFQACRGFITSLTGKRYVFTENDVPTNMQTRWVDGKPVIKRVGFTPTQIKNYPVQGFAGEILYVAVANLARALLTDRGLREKCLLINTVHDSIIFDIHKSALEEALVTIKKVMIDAPSSMNERFGINFDLPLKVEIKMGKTWHNSDQSKVEVEI